MWIQNLVYLDSHFCNKLFKMHWTEEAVLSIIKRGYFCDNIPVFDNYWPHLDSDFSAVEFFKLVILPFSQDLETCRHLIINSSWDASCESMTQHENIEKNITDSHL